MRHKRFCAAFILLFILSAGAQSASLPNQVESPKTTEASAKIAEEPQIKADVDGSFTIGNEVVKLNYAYAHKIKGWTGKGYDILVLLTDKPVPVKPTESETTMYDYIMGKHNLKGLRLRFTRHNAIPGRDPSHKDWELNDGKTYHSTGGLGFYKEIGRLELKEEGTVVSGSAEGSTKNTTHGELRISVIFTAVLKPQ
jgi:hypothetical protein